MLMRNSARVPSEDIAMMSMWSVLMRSWLWVLIAAGLSGATAFTALALMPAHYSATTELRLPASASKADVAATIAALKSHDLASKVTAGLDLASGSELNTQPMPRDIITWLDRLAGRAMQRPGHGPGKSVLAAFERSLRVTAGREAGTITITVTARSPELAALLADHLVELHLADARPAATRSAGGLARVDREIEELTGQLATIESEIARLAALSDGTLEAQRQNDLAEALAQAERERVDAEGRSRAVRELLDKGKVEAIAELQTSPTLHQLIAERVRVEVQKNGAARTLAPDHPRVQELQARLSELRWQMFREATAIAEALSVEVESARAREADVRTRYASASERASAPAASALDATRLAELEENAARKRTTLEALKARASTTASVPTRSAAPVRLAPAHAMAIPAFPQKGQLALLTAVSVLMIGFVAVIARVLLWGRRRSVAGTGFADMAATARDRADIRLDARPQSALPPEQDRPQDSVVDAPAGETSVKTAEPGQFVILSTAGDTARHLAGRAMGRKGYRSLLVADGIDGVNEARDLVSSLATSGRRCVLVDWSRQDRGIAASVGAAQQPGINDLLDGRAGFDDVFSRLPGSDAHFIPAGAPPADAAGPLDADWVNLVFDALDEAYDHIVIVAQLEPARSLFEAIEGRFDAGIIMSDRRGQGSTINAGPGVFLGFEVTEIYIVQMAIAQRASAARRFKRARRRAAA